MAERTPEITSRCKHSTRHLSRVIQQRQLLQSLDQHTPHLRSFTYLNYEAHSMMEEKIKVDLLSSLYSTQLVASGQRHLLDQNRNYYKLITKVVTEGQKCGEIRDDVSVLDITRYYSMCERALVYDWCLNKGIYSLGKYSKKSMPVMMEHFKTNK